MIVIGKQFPFTNFQNLAEAGKFIIGYYAVVILDFTDHLLINADIERLHLGGELCLGQPTLNAQQLKLAANNILMFVER